MLQATNQINARPVGVLLGGPALPDRYFYRVEADQCALLISPRRNVETENDWPIVEGDRQHG